MGPSPDTAEATSSRSLAAGRRAVDEWSDANQPVHDLIRIEACLRSSHGFLVDTLDGRELGVVDDVEVDQETGRIRTIEVCGGWFGRRRWTIDVTEVVTVYPALRRLVVETDQPRPDPRRAR